MTIWKALCFTLFVFIVPLCLCGCNESQVASVWTTDSIQVDGSSQDWNHLPRMTCDKPRFSCGICNNEQTLYFLFHFNNESLVKTIERGGLTLWIDPKGKKNKTYGLYYHSNRGPNFDRDFIPPGMESDEKRDRDTLKMRFKPPALDGLSLFFGSARNRIPLKADEAEVPAANSSNENGGSTIEFAIPLSSATAKYILESRPGDLVSMGIEFGKMNRDKMGRPGGGRGRGNGGMGSPGGGGQPPEGMRPGGGESGGSSGGHGFPGGSQGGSGRGGMSGHGPGQGEREKTEETEIWMKLLLAKPPVVSQ